MSDTDLKTRFFQAMSAVPATVNVVTTDGPAGRAGVTVSAMSSVSADTPKPTLLVCINTASPAAAAIEGNGAFCVNVLRDRQSYISDAFAGRYKDQLASKFDCANWTEGRLGQPHVRDGLVGFECRVAQSERVGTHHVIFGEIHDINMGAPGSALVYANRGYAASQGLGGRAPANFETREFGERLVLGCFHSFAPSRAPGILARMATAMPGLDVALVEGDQRHLVEGVLSGALDAALVYDFELGTDLRVQQLGSVRPYVMLPAAHALAGRPDLAVEDLAGLAMISLPESASQRRLEGLLDGLSLPPRIAHRAATLETVRGLVARGLGFAIAMTRPSSDLSHEGLPVACVPLRSAEPSGIVLVTRRATDSSDKVLAALRTHALEPGG